MIWGGGYIKFIVGLNPIRLDSSVVRASGIMSPYEFTSKTHSLSTEDLGKFFIH